MPRRNDMNALYITGLGHEYPTHTLKQEDFQTLVERLYPDEVTSPWFQKLFSFHLKTGILSRPTISDWTKEDVALPTIASLSRTFRNEGVKLTSSACRKALQEACLTPSDITHIVAVTSTDHGNPGYDLLVAQNLGLSTSLQRTLLHGVGCAGGLSALRAAADIATAASQRGRPARVLVAACELCSLFLRAELEAACRDGALHIAQALFSDAAAAVVVCNELALGKQKVIFELREWGSMIVPGTSEIISLITEQNGMISTITKDVPRTAISAITPMFDQLRNDSSTSKKSLPLRHLKPAHFDWALHPGGAAILRGAQQALDLNDDHIRASLDVYEHFGNSSSPTVLIVLDKMRSMGEGRDNVVATSFGPGFTIEMCILRRSSHVNDSQPLVTGQHGMLYKLWLSLHSRLSRRVVRKGPAMIKTWGKT